MDASDRPGLDWRAVWQYRELLVFLAWRDISVRYKQTVLGALWAVIQPLMTMVVFTIFFGRLAGIDRLTGTVPYPVYVYSGLLPWTFFTAAVTASSNSMLSGANLVRKIYFPRIILPLAATGVAVVDLAIAASVLVLLMIGFGVPLSLQAFMVPLFVLGAILTAVGIGSLVAALNVSYRDFRYVMPFVLQLWLFVSPVIYPPSFVPAEWRPLLALNPMTGMIEGFRASCLGLPYDWWMIGVSAMVGLTGFVVGVRFFLRTERSFADLV